MDASRDGVSLRGDVALKVINQDGTIAHHFDMRNLIVNGGLDYIKELLLDSVNPTALTTLTHIAIGSDGTAPAPTNVALGLEVVRRAFDSYTPQATGIATVATEFPPGTGPGTFAEAALFDAASGGNMVNHVVFPSPITIDALQRIAVSMTLTFANT